MTTFEVTIETADAKGLKLLVSAEHWVDAWTEGLAVMGDPLGPPDASCVIDGGTARIDVPSTGRTFVVRPLGWEPPGAGRPEPGLPLLLTSGDLAGPAIRIVASRGAPEVVIGDASSRAPGTPTTGRRQRPVDATLVDRPTLPLDDDPVARVLSDLERQRLGARPVRLDPTGLPEPVDASSRRRPTPHAVPRQARSGEAGRARGRDDTVAFTPPVAGGADALPQQFRPVVPSSGRGGEVPPTRAAALEWAVETAWSHVPCALALVLGGLDRDDPEVLLARGERERETRGCRVPLELGFRQLACRAPTRVRFAERAVVHFVGGGAGFDVEVASTLCAPIAFVPGHESPSTRGLGLVLLNSTRASGFTDSELRAVTYLARTLAERLEAQ